MVSIPRPIEPLEDPSSFDLLRESALLDTPAEETFDRFTRLASKMLGAPVALISLLDPANDRQFFKSQYGQSEPVLSARQTPLSHSFCKHLIGATQPLIVPDARRHPLLRNNPAIKDNNVIAYLGVPLQTTEGQTFGALCTIDGKPRQWSPDDVMTLEDLGAGVMTEIQLRLLAAEAMKHYLHVRDLELQRDELTDMLVHDLRNPLNSMLMGLELVEASCDLGKEGKKHLDISRRSGAALVRMISNLLDVSKAKAGKLELNLGKVLPRDILDEAYEQTLSMAQKAGVTVSKIVASQLPSTVIDREKLRRVLVNLASNAVQHTPRGGRVSLSVEQRGSALVFEVSDTGFGISKDAFSQIFERYNRVHSPGTNKISSGLGLHFCKLAVEAHGGEINVSSELDHGTTFRVEIPISRPA